MQDVLGQAIRKELVDSEIGVPLHLDLQVIDVNTCEPIKGVFIEMWSRFCTLHHTKSIACLLWSIDWHSF